MTTAISKKQLMQQHLIVSHEFRWVRWTCDFNEC